MKLQLQRETLLKPLQLVIGVVERKQTLPILSNVLIDIKDQKISITGTDLEVELIGQANLENDISNASKITVPGRKLIDICKALPENAPIELFQEKERVILKSGKSRFALSTLPAEEFPNVETTGSQVEFNIGQDELYYLLQHTYFSMAQQDVRYYLNGLLLEVTPNKLRAVATDGHRLAVNTIDAPIPDTPRIQVIIPRKGVLELMRLLDGTSDNTVSVKVSNNNISIKQDDYTFTSKLIDGRFPDYDRVIPKNPSKKVLVDRDLFKQALMRTAILCNEKFRGLRLEIRNGLLKIFANNPEQETAEEEIVADYAGNNLDIGFNVTYLLDIINILPSGPMQLSLTDSNSSILIEVQDEKHDGVYVVMPMRL